MPLLGKGKCQQNSRNTRTADTPVHQNVRFKMSKCQILQYSSTPMLLFRRGLIDLKLGIQNLSLPPMSESLSLSTSCGFSSCRGGTLEGAFFLFALLGGTSAFLAKLAAFLASLCCFLWMTAGQVPYFLTDSRKEKPRDINSRI